MSPMLVWSRILGSDGFDDCPDIIFDQIPIRIISIMPIAKILVEIMVLFF
jgi:hypothetical protein